MSGVIGRTAKAVDSFFWNTLKLKNIVSNVQINGPFYFYRNYFGQMLNYINLRGGIVAYTMGYNNDPTDSFNGDIQGTNYLVENLRRNGATTVNEKYKASNQKIIDGYWSEKYKPKNTFSKQRNIGNIVNLNYPDIIDVRNNYDFDELQNELRKNIFVSPTTEDGTQVREIYTFPDVLEIENTFYQKYQRNDFIRALTFNQFSNKVHKDKSLIHNSHDGGLTSYSFYNEDNQNNTGNNPLTGNSITVDSGIPVNLIERTQILFQNNKIKTLINRFNSVLDENDLNDLDSGYDSVYGYSRGRNLKKSDNKATAFEGGYKSPYCRTWTAFHQYDKLSRLIRPIYHGNIPEKISDTQSGYKDLRPNNGALRLENNTVLDRTGFVKITPISSTNDKNHDIKKCMFSIENLAWRDIKLDDAKISKEQQGPNGGRIMWFPPYNLKFTENVNVDWNANKFIGRGEQIYTYTNTDRQGTLNFTLLIDHPSILNKYVGQQKNIEAKLLEEDILRYFAGCGDLNGESSNEKIEPKGKQFIPLPELKARQKKQTEKITLIAFFPNDWTGINYENDLENGYRILRLYEKSKDSAHTFTEIDEKGLRFKNSEKNYDLFQLNNFSYNDDAYNEIKKMFNYTGDFKRFYSFFDEENGVGNLTYNISNSHIFEFLTTLYKLKSIKITGFASTHGNNNTINKAIAKRRGEFLRDLCFHKCKQLKGIIEEQNIEIPIETQLGQVSDNEKKIVKTEEIIELSDNDRGGYTKRGDLDEITDYEDTYDYNTNQSSEPRYTTIIKKELQDLTSEEQINTLRAKLARCAYITFEVEWKSQTVPSNTNIEPGNFTVNEDMSESTSGNSSNNQNEMSATVVEENKEDYSYDNEYLYFQDIANNGKMQYEYIANKVKYFNPAFHSITPEGFNARLTFLHQCTRQGPTNDLSSGKIDSNSNSYLKYAGNLAFGRPPYCILRIGDFYHTKICITALSIDYDNGGGIQWDLNPEGVGVQPMFANITMNFTFLGGQDLTGPIERLQNAVTANYYANASVYDNKADIRGSNGEMEKIYDPTQIEKNKLTQKLKQQTAPPTSFARPGFGSGFGSLSGQTI